MNITARDIVYDPTLQGWRIPGRGPATNAPALTVLSPNQEFGDTRLFATVDAGEGTGAEDRPARSERRGSRPFRGISEVCGQSRFNEHPPTGPGQRSGRLGWGFQAEPIIHDRIQRPGRQNAPAAAFRRRMHGALLRTAGSWSRSTTGARRCSTGSRWFGEARSRRSSRPVRPSRP